MFVPYYRLKNLVQKAGMVLRLPLEYVAYHPFRALQRRALDETAEFIRREMPAAVAFDTPRELLAHALARTGIDGIIAEFGVNGGGSVNFIADRVKGRQVEGFDSFAGLPEDWAGAHITRGYFSRAGRPPRVRRNVRLHAGWFRDTLPAFVAGNPGNCAFLHIDCDIYSSTATILEHLGPRIVPGTVIVFDEYFNYPNWQAHEHRAFTEFIRREQRKVEYLGYSYAQVAVVMR
jgi:predicted O-methyltransferase YrrM